MSRLIRAALVWLVAIALPLQGLAAAAMSSCAAGHHRMAALQGFEPGEHDHAMHSHAAHGHEQLAMHRHAAFDEAAVADDGAMPAQDRHELAKFKCSACAVCCITPALPSAVTAPDPLPQAQVFDTFGPDRSVRFLTGGPERPPRPTLA